MTNDMRAWQDPVHEDVIPGYVVIGKNYAYTRPVLVIDPDNDEHIEAILAALDDLEWHIDRDDMRAALRSLLAPPKTKPAEPDEHGAKVIDKGVQYVASERRELGDHRGLWFWTADNGARRSWGQFSGDVEVLP